MTTALINVIREQRKKKGRKLKIISDWDDCLMPIKPRIIYREVNPNIPFKKFFTDFWEFTDVTTSSISTEYLESFQGGDSETEKALKKFIDERKNNNKPVKPVNADVCLKPGYQNDFYKDGEFLSTAEDLLHALKEDLINELIIITANQKAKGEGKDKIENFAAEKRAKIKNTFGKFPNVKISISQVKKGPDGRFTPHRWEVIRDEFPDFDMYIDDNPSLIANSPSTLKFQKQVPDIKDKIFVLNDYKSNRKAHEATGPNIYHVKTTVSDLKNEDFEKVAEELKAKKKQERKDWVEKVMKKSIWKQPNTYLFLLSGVSLTLLVVFLIMAVRKKRK